MKIDNIEQYLPLIKKIASQYSNLPIPFEDLIQEGYLGLIEAAKRYDSEKEAKFSTYAVFWIKKMILQAIDKEAIDKVTSLDDKSRVHEAAKEVNEPTKIDFPPNFPAQEKQILLLLYEKNLTLREVAKELNLSYEKARQLKELAKRRIRLNYSDAEIDSIFPKNIL